LFISFHWVNAQLSDERLPRGISKPRTEKTS
jgi:hypothetical protein